MRTRSRYSGAEICLSSENVTGGALCLSVNKKEYKRAGRYLAICGTVLRRGLLLSAVSHWYFGTVSRRVVGVCPPMPTNLLDLSFGSVENPT
ncbi:hypothetical protein ARMSODRAFT_954411 [Armillaria solidipes]|uniref:Uncharacterized protein n=1 Tax=Armillaria solidipes TaxID=1076256 RepID=A0A2H3C8L0_9AGAR|nr:hypothetical protein ARMSODRAFT_954411 [Armillaria solidipes]